MNFSDFKYISESTESILSRGYQYTSNEINQLIGSTSTKFPFGNMENDSVEVTVMTVNGETIASTVITSSLNYAPFTKSYIDVKNQGITYNYQQFQSDFVTVGMETQSLFLDIAQIFKDVNIAAGTYKIGIDPIRYMVGTPFDSNRTLAIREISPTRKEILVSPTVIPTSTDIRDINLYQQYTRFVGGNFQTKQIISPLLTAIERPSIYNAYYQAYQTDSGSAEVAKQWYAFLGDIDWNGIQSGVKSINYQDRRNSDVAVIHFITDIYYGVRKGSLRSNGQISNRDIYGIFDQFKNTLFQNYESTVSFDEIRTFYYSLFNYILDKELNQITNTKPSNMAAIIAFFSNILYDIIFVPAIAAIEEESNSHFTGYLKNSAYFSNGSQLPILNYTQSTRVDSSGTQMLILKFIDPIDTQFSINDRLIIVNKMVTDTVVQSMYLYTQSEYTTILLRGPNMLYKTENEGNGTQQSSIEDIIEVTGSLYDEVYTKLQGKEKKPVQLNVDYRYFENFIQFSSATDRISAFEYKLTQIETARVAASDLELKLSINPNDQQYNEQLTEANNTISTIEAGMDGYETFLYNNPSWYNTHTEEFGSETSSSLYDKDNLSSLIYSIPSYIREDDSNVDYVKFVSMVGHYFDNLSLYIKQFTQKNDPANSDSVGISKEIVHSMLSSLGWEPEVGRENLPLLLSSFSKDDFDVGTTLWNMVGSMSEDDRNRTIWKRILNNLSYILKTKGTEAGVRSLMNCYGIPMNLISIKEYGGIENSPNVEQDSIFTFDETKYSIGFRGSNEYVKIPWSGSVQSVEFDFSFDPNKTVDEGQVFRVVNCSNNWIIGFYRERGAEWGRAFFSITDTGSNVITTMTDKAPIFNGEVYSVLLRKNKIHSDFLLAEGTPYATSDLYPQKYELFVQRNDGDRATYSVSASVLLSGSFNSQWRTGSYLYLGNYQQTSMSFGIDPEAFFGSIDEVKLWETSLDLSRFDSHVSYHGAYDASSPSDVIDKSLVRISFGYPVDLYAVNGTSSFENFAYKQNVKSVTAINFPPASSSVTVDDCGVSTYSNEYPYQFVPHNVNQSVTLPNFGSNKYRSNKINHKTQKLLGSLSATSRSTLPSVSDSSVDSNKLGIFFSPTDQINSEIMKFFGNFEFGDLIGSPLDVYKRTYPNFEQFRKLYFDLGGGRLDYQTYLNMIRAYFDKSLFKYIKNLVPARSKVVTGILIEPNLLERSKIQQKPIQQEIHRNIVSSIPMVENKPTANVIPQLTQSLDIKTRGVGLYDDFNRTFYDDRLDPHGFGIYADNGIAYFNNDYWRAEVIGVKKTMIVERRDQLSLASGSEWSRVNADNGRYQIISRSFEEVNISRFPILTHYPVAPTLVATTLDSSDVEKKTEFTVFTGQVEKLNSLGNLINAPIETTISGFFEGIASTGYVMSSSMEAGVITKPVGVSGTVPFGSTMYLSGSYTNYVFTGKILINNWSTVAMYFYSPDKKSSIYTTLFNSTTGELFGNIVNQSYTYRRDLSLRNIPSGAKPLNGYHFTHYKYKRQMFSRRAIPLLSSQGVITSTFKRSQQTQKTTIQENGLSDNSPPIVVIKQS